MHSDEGSLPLNLLLASWLTTRRLNKTPLIILAALVNTLKSTELRSAVWFFEVCVKAIDSTLVFWKEHLQIYLIKPEFGLSVVLKLRNAGESAEPAETVVKWQERALVKNNPSYCTLTYGTWVWPHLDYGFDHVTPNSQLFIKTAISRGPLTARASANHIHSLPG